jgi:anti-sigma factor RsiW
MTDCSNVEVREQLPEFVSGRLSAADDALVRHHLESCADCSHEVEILRIARSLRPLAPPLDVSRIVGALPSPMLRRQAAGGRWSPARVRVSAWRVAAAIGFVALGGLSWQVARDGSRALLPGGGTTDSVLQVASAADSGTPRPDSMLILERETASMEVAVSFGNLGDYTDEELQLILDRLDQWDGAASADPLPTLPLVPPGSENR